MTQQDSNPTELQVPPEGMTEDAKEPQGAGVTEIPSEPAQQGSPAQVVCRRLYQITFVFMPRENKTCGKMYFELTTVPLL